MTVDFEHSVGDEVTVIHAPDISGRVSAMTLNKYGKGYRVIWWDSGKRFEEWLEGWEIERSKK